MPDIGDKAKEMAQQANKERQAASARARLEQAAAARQAQEQQARIDAAGAEARGRVDDAIAAARERAAAAREAATAGYTVKAGDSLSSIARELLGDASRWKELYELNKAAIGANPDVIKIGTELKLPH